MAQDPYSVLGVGRQTSAEDIRKAYRKLAKQYHPDRNPGDKAAEDRFKQISAAFDIVGDEDKRARFDRGELDADGNERSPFAGGAGAGGARWQQRGPGPGTGPGGFEDLSDIFGDFFGQRASGARRGPIPQKGSDIRYRLSVDFLDAARGATKRVALPPDGREINVGIPEGLRDGQTLRLRGKGSPGINGGAAGDVLVEVTVKPHSVFQLKGDDLTVDVPITLKEAILGAKIEIPTLKGPVAIRVPPNTSSSVSFRLRGKGLKDPKTGIYGDLFARTKIVLPDQPDNELEAFAKSWSPSETDPRAKLKQAA
ncbi:DnaJ C-terminal domain-containing protein [Parvularcula sp. LCG005]|uniref:DnaJ C-terminal domain-containing protein n=1 Tax=Parvularcula sp. LCG005 TaxID=3078805 RepID=UPI002942EC63|nr:DnaJ C-terminal domain-containing protein [Parvularcula sp. LCG005]WOI54003.1 DnaJ C-terminal domain-containing protein [Parvularcula sp. LCG005]